MKTPRDPNSNKSKRREDYLQKGPIVSFQERFVKRAMKAGFTQSQAEFLFQENN